MRQPNFTQTLSRSQLHARTILRRRGQFVSNAAQPGTSASTLRRNAQKTIQETPSRRRLNVEEVVNALLCAAPPRHFVPACIEDGPLLEIVELLLKPQFRIATRLMLGVAKGVYLSRTRKRSLPRRHLKREGRIIKRRATVFSAVRLPDPDRDDTLTDLKRVLAKHHRKGRVDHADVDTAINEIKPLLRTYNSVSFEYSGYPRLPSAEAEARPEITRASAQSQPDTTRSIPPSNIQIYVERVDTTAATDSEYAVLKSVLAMTNPVLLRGSVLRWERVFLSLRDGGHLTSVEKTIIEYALEENPQRREFLRKGLEQLLLSLMEIREAACIDLMLELGYNPAGFHASGVGSESGNGIELYDLPVN